jgi:hypothetical protein
MAFMKPQAQYFTKEEARDYAPCSDFEEGIDSSEYEAGWYSRLSAPGYLDCTDWQGPYDTEEEALQEVMELYEVDENGDDPDGMDEMQEEDLKLDHIPDVSECRQILKQWEQDQFWPNVFHINERGNVDQLVIGYNGAKIIASRV